MALKVLYNDTYKLLCPDEGSIVETYSGNLIFWLTSLLDLISCDSPIVGRGALEMKGVWSSK